MAFIAVPSGLFSKSAESALGKQGLLRSGVALCFNCPQNSVQCWLPWNPFLSSVVLLTDYSSMGAVGFIVNKGFSHDDVSKSIPENVKPFRLGYGGPVSTRRGGGWAVLHNGGADCVARVM